MFKLNLRFGGTEMRSPNSSFRSVITPRLAGFLTFVCLQAATFTLLASLAAGQQQGEQTFASPGEAVEAMISAAKAGNTDGLMQIFGPDAKQVISSGDPVADKNTRDR